MRLDEPFGRKPCCGKHDGKFDGKAFGPKHDGPKFDGKEVYKEREILKLRTLAALGYSINEVDEALPLSDYLKPENEKKYKTNNKLLTVLESACSACVKSRYMVSEICKECLSRKCINACDFGAISFEDTITLNQIILTNINVIMFLKKV